MNIRIIGNTSEKKILHLSPDKEIANRISLKKNQIDKETSSSANFSSKPWGFEYQLLKDRRFDIWELSINPQASTSFHFHGKKDVLVLILRGIVTLSTTDQNLHLGPGKFILLGKGVCHQLKNESVSTVRILEIESPPDRNDLTRIEDNYGRENLPYFYKNQPEILGKGKENQVPSPTSDPDESNGFFNGFPFTLPDSNKDCPTFRIIFHKKMSANQKKDFNQFRQYLARHQIGYILVLQGHVFLNDKTYPRARRGDCINISDPESIRSISERSVFIAW